MMRIKNVSRCFQLTNSDGCVIRNSQFSLKRCDKMIIFLVIFLFVLLTWKWRHHLKLAWQMPGPWPVISAALVDVIPQMDELSIKYKEPIRLFAICKLAIFISDADNAKLILGSRDCLNKPDMFYKILRDGIGVDGLATLDAEKWKLHRRLVRPALSLSSVTEHMDIFNRCIRHSIASLSMENDFFDVLPYLNVCMLTMFLEASLGNELDHKIRQQYLVNFRNTAQMMIDRLMQPIMYLDFVWKRSNSAKQMIECQKFNQNICHKILQNMRESIDGVGGKISFVEKLYRIGEENVNFTAANIYAETVTIMSGATETMSTAVGFVAIMLALDTECQEKVYQEITAVMPDTKMDLTQSDLDELVFTDLCIRETLRLFPSIPFIARISSKSMTLTNGIVVPPQTPFVVGLRQISRKKEYFGPTAHQFDPNRFNDERMKRLPAAAYIPFSYGPRNCIGYYHAQVGLKLYIAHMVRSYRITTSYKNIDELRPIFNVGLRLADQHMIKLERRI